MPKALEGKVLIMLVTMECTIMRELKFELAFSRVGLHQLDTTAVSQNVQTRKSIDFQGNCTPT